MYRFYDEEQLKLKPILLTHIIGKLKSAPGRDDSDSWLRPWTVWSCSAGAFASLLGYFLANYVDPTAGFDLMKSLPLEEFQKALTQHLGEIQQWLSEPEAMERL